MQCCRSKIKQWLRWSCGAVNAKGRLRTIFQDPETSTKRAIDPSDLKDKWIKPHQQLLSVPCPWNRNEAGINDDFIGLPSLSSDQNHLGSTLARPLRCTWALLFLSINASSSLSPTDPDSIFFPSSLSQLLYRCSTAYIVTEWRVNEDSYKRKTHESISSLSLFWFVENRTHFFMSSSCRAQTLESGAQNLYAIALSFF